MKQENRCLGCHADVGPSPGWHDCATTAEKQVERLEARLAEVMAALSDDGSGTPVAELLSFVADVLRQYGGGSLEDRCRYAAQALRAAEGQP